MILPWHIPWNYHNVSGGDSSRRKKIFQPNSETSNFLSIFNVLGYAHDIDLALYWPNDMTFELCLELLFKLGNCEDIDYKILDIFFVSSRQSNNSKHSYTKHTLHTCSSQSELTICKEKFSDSNNLFLWCESKDMSKKTLLQKFQLIPILRFQAMHGYVHWHCSIDYCVKLNLGDKTLCKKLLLFDKEMISA